VTVLNEQEAKNLGLAYEVSHYDLLDLDRAIADSEAHGFVKVLTVPGKDKILGVTIVGQPAGELIAEYVLAMKWRWCINKLMALIPLTPIVSRQNCPYPNGNRHA
jgi:pyruvate/2-oxoglutarate dehydrogenase complex dihydrolipoamide dehydrogenase (E3) component